MIKFPLTLSGEKRMLTVETIKKIRIRYHVKKESIKQIARELNLSRNTVRKVIREEKTSNEYQRRNQPKPQLGDHEEQLSQWLKEDSKLAKSQRCSARRLYERLKEKGYTGAYDSVQRFVKEWKLESGKVPTAFIPLYYSPGEAYQFDWSEETVELGGIVQTVKVAQFRLCYSRLMFVVAYPRETQEMLFDAHAQAFDFFKGIPLRGIYDNMKTAVDTVFTGKERQFNQRFLQMMSHYLIELTACTPSAGWEKGQIENQVGNVREWFFVPRLKFADLSQLNAHLHQRCLEIGGARKHPHEKDKLIITMYEEEQGSLRPLIPSFDGYIQHCRKVSSTCLVNFDRNHYSVDCRYANQACFLRAYAKKIVITAKDTVIGEHERQFGRGKAVYDPWHYVPLLEKKPGALRNGAPFRDWEFPEGIQKIRELLMKQRGGDKGCVSILTAIRAHGLEAVNVACELALTDKVINADYILNLINRLRPTPRPAEIPMPDNLRLKHEPKADFRRYDALLQGVSHVLH
jgi:transposase